MSDRARSRIFVGSEAFAVTEAPSDVADALEDAEDTTWLVFHNRSGGEVTVSAGSIDGVTPMPGPLTSALAPLRGVLSVLRDLTVVATLVVAVLALFPDLTPSTKEVAAIQSVHVDRNVRFQEYMNRHLIASALGGGHIRKNTRYQPPGDAHGVVVEFQIVTSGLRHKDLPMRWTLYSKADSRVVATSEDRDPLGQVVLTPAKREKDLGTWEAWIDVSQCSKPCYVRLELYDSDGNRLAYRDTAKVTTPSGARN